jgi:hypothetical protein
MNSRPIKVGGHAEELDGAVDTLFATSRVQGSQTQTFPRST